MSIDDSLIFGIVDRVSKVEGTLLTHIEEQSKYQQAVLVTVRSMADDLRKMRDMTERNSKDIASILATYKGVAATMGIIITSISMVFAFWDKIINLFQR